MLERAGAREVVAIEANRRAYLKCLVVKELLGLQHVRYHCGDFNAYLQAAHETFDVVFASGVLYHQLDPMAMMCEIARLARAVFLWTHYYDAERIAANAALDGRFGPFGESTVLRAPVCKGGIPLPRSPQMGRILRRVAIKCVLLPRADLLGALSAFGFGRIDIAFDHHGHPNGPSFALLARK